MTTCWVALLFLTGCTDARDVTKITGASPVFSVSSVSPESVSVAVGKSIQLAALNPGDNELDATWSSSNPEVAAVSPSGLVTGVAEGTATITAAWQQGSSNTVITVTAADGDSAPPEESDPSPPADAISVLDFGAVGDGRTDNTTAFRNAIESAGKNKKALYIPSGRYLITSSLTIDYGIEFVGDGHEKSVITSNKGSARLMVRQSGTAFRDLGFENMVEPIALVSREGYVLENLRFERCRFERMVATNVNRGVIGLSSGNSSQRPHRINNLVVQGCIFRDIDAFAINVRGNISSAHILDNEFTNIINARDDTSAPLGGFAIRLGSQYPDEFDYRIEGNVIRKMRKISRNGNLIGILLYGGRHTIQNNLIEDIDGTADGLDVNAIYIKGFSNQILHNTIRNIRGADDDGALCIKDSPEYSRDNIVAHNVWENIHGMSAAEIVTTNLQFYRNTIRNASLRGFYHRLGENLLLRDNTFENASAVLRTHAGVARVTGNRFVESGLFLSSLSSRPAERETVYIHDNTFERSSKGRTIGLTNDVEETFVSIVGNAFRALSAGEHQVDLIANGTVQAAERKDNTIEGSFTYRGP